jgi:hypothetical protein
MTRNNISFDELYIILNDHRAQAMAFKETEELYDSILAAVDELKRSPIPITFRINRRD